MKKSQEFVANNKECFLEETVEYFDNWKDNMLMLRFDDAIYV